MRQDIVILTVAMIVNINLYEERPFLERPLLCYAFFPLQLRLDGMPELLWRAAVGRIATGINK